ncbi:glucohydrolase [Oenococcus oeni]|uniref:glycoside hydrolase family 13 protein n=2 Tax=Oenococcus oeni TaxID=1247 RepID=UPI0008F86258|nr:alpha-glucosidase [Oenococcus oeni]OIK85224.1 glucohydrolase [Oenococcus oeni]OIL10632.1 glucohydrolase [Oenococcus oeni]OIL11245.1 glucohydrolase [Oenococcus oeni]
MSETPWWQQAVIYQIYPKSFNDTDGDGIGDLQGVINKMDYLKELGIDAIWLCPIYQSPQVDNGYDITDYRTVDLRYGNNQDLERLIHVAHQYDIKIIMDMVANHTSDQCQWFKESKLSRNNYFSDWYIWRDPKIDGSEPNNWGSNFGGSAWTYVPDRKQYYLHYYAPGQPDLNWENPRVREAIYDMMRYWKAHGVDGWRMDVVTSISKDQRFLNNANPQKLPFIVANQNNGPRLHEFLQEMHKEVLEPFSMMSVGESPDSTANTAYQLVDPKRKELDMVFTFEHMHVDRKKGGMNGRWDVQPFDLIELKHILASWQNKLDGRGWNALYFENHDRARTPSRWGNDKKYRYESSTAFATVLHGLKGTPFIYQGEEIGMTNPNFQLEDYEDIELKSDYKKYVDEYKTITKTDFLKAAHKISRDNARTPMQWDASRNSGFTTGKPWFKLNPNYSKINVKNDLKSHKSVFHYYQYLIRLRHENTILTEGTFELILPEHPQVFAYLRQEKNKKWLIFANLSDQNIVNPLTNFCLEEKQVIVSNYVHPDWEKLVPYQAAIIMLT